MDAIKKVLVVDDDPVVGKSFNRVLTAKGYAVITAMDGEEALNKLRAEKYDAVFTDIKMPGMSGLEVAERVKASQPWLPVVIITGYGTEANEARARAAGVAGFLHKPLSPEMIEASADKAMLEAGAPVAAAAGTAVPEAPEAAAPEGRESIAKNIALFLAAPFIGLAYLIAFPFVGLGALAWMGVRAAAMNAKVRHGVLFAAAPLIGLGYVVAAPFIGLALLLRAGIAAIRKPGGPG